MPELPEVEAARRLAHEVLVGRRLVEVRCADDRVVFEGDTPRAVRSALLGARVLGTGRRGKYFWFELDRRPWPLLHFGMTGTLRIRGRPGLALAHAPSDPSWPPRFAKLHMRTDDDVELVFTNARRLGRIRLRNDPPTESPIRELGFDPLLDMPRLPEFARRLRMRRGVLKGLLLDQSFAAGVGNWVADEVLFQAGIDPHRTASSLDDDEVRRLRRSIAEVVRRAVRVDADADRFPRSWLFHHRWTPRPEATTAAGDRIVWTALAGRTTAWVPARQR